MMRYFLSVVLRCAKREDVMITIQKGRVFVFVLKNPEDSFSGNPEFKAVFNAEWSDKIAMMDINYELKEGKCKKREANTLIDVKEVKQVE